MKTAIDRAAEAIEAAEMIFANEMGAILELARAHGLAVIEDSACSVASTYRGRACGTLGTVGIWSFDSMKILDQACDVARAFRPMGDAEVRALLAKTAGAAVRGDFEPFKTSSIFDSTAENPEWLGEEPKRLQSLMQ